MSIKQIFKTLPINIFLFSLINVSPSFAQQNKLSIECYETLKKSIVYNSEFIDLYQTIKDQSYTDLQWTRYYQSAASYGIDLQKPLFQVRYASFGPETAYRHPPKNDLPVSMMTEKWDFEAKKFFLQEEYIKGPNRTNIFQGCMAVHIGGKEPILASEYWYDGEPLLVRAQTTLPSGTTAQILFSKHTSYTYENQIHADWTRLSVYPDNQNDYFNRSQLIPWITQNETRDMTQVYRIKETKSPQATSVVVTDKNGYFMQDSEWPEYLEPKRGDDFYQFFYEAQLYEAIEAKFPTFYENMAVWGVYKLETIKALYEVLSEEKITFKKRQALYDLADVKTYLVQKHNNIQTPVIRRMQQEFINGNMNEVLLNEIQKSRDTAHQESVENFSTPRTQDQTPQDSLTKKETFIKKTDQPQSYGFHWFVIALAGLGGLGLFWYKIKK